MENLDVIKNYNNDNDKLLNEIDEKLDYLLKQQEGILTEQEKQRLRTMTIEELQTEILRVMHEMKHDLDQMNDVLKRGEK